MNLTPTQLEQYLRDNYGDCKLGAQCACNKDDHPWLGAQCRHWVPKGYKTWTDVLQAVKDHRKKPCS